MATADPLTPAARQAVAGQLAGLLPALPVPATEAVTEAAPRELTESFAVCFLDAAQVKRPPADLSALARPSGVWHHQVRTGGVATHFARSVQPGFNPDGLGVEQLAESPIAARLDRAVGWIDRRVKGRATARLLVVPAYFVHAFLLVRPGGKLSAVLADQPDGFKQLEYEREYPLAEFLKRLAKEKPAATFG